MLADDSTKEERIILAGSIASVYSPFTDPVDKLLLALRFELGYPSYLCAHILRLSEPTVSIRIKKIKTILSLKYSIRLE